MQTKIIIVLLCVIIFGGIFVTVNMIRQVTASSRTDQITGNFYIKSLDLNYSSLSPVTLLINVKNAVQMRFGNTENEANLSQWEPYAPSKEWLLKTGPGTKTVYAEFINASNTIYRTTAELSVGLVTNTFDWGQDNWWVYNYAENTEYNVFYPTSWESKGGLENTGFIWAGDSRWSIDSPEEPDSILALLTYPSWSGNKALDLRNATVSVYLRGDDLDLKGAQIYFWVHSRARWHFTSHPLTVSQGQWGNKVTFKLLNDESLWHRSYSADPNLNSLDFTLGVADSYGFSFIGFPPGNKVTGKLSMDEFTIEPNQSN